MVDRGIVNDAGFETGQGHQRTSTSNAETYDTASAARSQLVQLETALNASSRLEIVDCGREDFHGPSSGFAFLAQLQKKHGDLLSPEVAPSTEVTTRPDLLPIFDWPQSFEIGHPQIPPPLPPKTVAEDLVESALENVCALSQIVHRPTFYLMFNRVYDLGTVKYGTEETKFLPLLYALMALGCFASTIQIERNGQKRAMAAG